MNSRTSASQKPHKMAIISTTSMVLMKRIRCVDNKYLTQLLELAMELGFESGGGEGSLVTSVLLNRWASIPGENSHSPGKALLGAQQAPCSSRLWDPAEDRGQSSSQITTISLSQKMLCGRE